MRFYPDLTKTILNPMRPPSHRILAEKFKGEKVNRGHLPYIVRPTQTTRLRHVNKVGHAGGAQRKREHWAVLAEGT